MKKTAKIYVAGHQGLVGSAIVRRLKRAGCKRLVLKTKPELDLLDQKAVLAFFAKEKPEYVFLAAAKVGGILANQDQPAQFSYENLMIEANIIQAAYIHKTKKLLFLGSSCIYPRDAKQPIKEEYLLSGPLEKTNEAYAIAKIAGLKLCQYYNEQYGTNFIAVMPTNLYGPGDNFSLRTSHVLPALIRKFHEAKEKKEKEVTLWGSGSPRREFLYVDDLADALLCLMEKYEKKELINIGSGQELNIKSLTEKIKRVTGFKGKIVWDRSKPDGTPRKRLDISRLKRLGWTPKTSLDAGIKSTYRWFLDNQKKLRKDD